MPCLPVVLKVSILYHIRTTSKPRVHFNTGQQPEYAPMDILEHEFENLQILPGAALSRFVFFGGTDDVECDD